MHPITLTCLAFVAGVALAPWVGGAVAFWLGLAALGVVLRRPLPRVGGCVAALALGVATCRLVPVGPSLRGDVVVVGVRVGAASGRDGHVSVRQVRQVGGPWQATSGRVQVRWPQRPPPAGSEVVVFGHASSALTQRLPGAPDATRAMHRVGVHTQVRARRIRVLGPAASSPRPAHDPTGLLTALTIGDRSGLDPHTVAVLRATGTAHLLAISGFHVGVVALMVALLAARMRRAAGVFARRGLPRLELGAGIVAATVYCQIAGAPISAQRAAGLLALAAAGRVVGRGARVEPMLGCIAVAVLWIDPAAIATPSFQLSFGAVVGLVRLGSPLQARLPQGRWRWLSSGVAATTSATVGTLPAAAWWFQDLSLTSPLANLIALPLTSTVLVPSAAVATFGPHPVSDWADAVGSWAAWLLVVVLEPLAIEPLHPAVGPLGALVLGVAVLLAHRPALAALLAALAFAFRPLPRVHTVTFLNVGQGDATLVEHADGRRWLVDGGPGRNDVTAYLRRRGLRRIDRVVATHNQRDHIAGLERVVATLRVGELHVSGHEGLGVLRTAAEARGVPIRRASGLHPPVGYDAGSNDRSVVMATGPVLLTGDIEARAEHEVARHVGPFQVLKVPHHGSTTSSSPTLLDAVAPDVAVVSVGLGNPWGHPRPRILARYARRGIAVLRTDREGTLQWTPSGWWAHRPGRGWFRPELHPPEVPGMVAPWLAAHNPGRGDPTREVEVACPEAAGSWSSWSPSSPSWALVPSTCGRWSVPTLSWPAP